MGSTDAGRVVVGDAVRAVDIASEVASAVDVIIKTFSVSVETGVVSVVIRGVVVMG